MPRAPDHTGMAEREIYQFEAGTDARGLNAFLTAAFERDRWNAVRQSALVLLTLFGVPCWLMAAWPGVLGECLPQVRPGVVGDVPDLARGRGGGRATLAARAHAGELARRVLAVRLEVASIEQISQLAAIARVSAPALHAALQSTRRTVAAAR